MAKKKPWEEMGITQAQYEELRYQAKLELARRDFWEFCKLLAPDFYMEGRDYLKEFCYAMQEFYETDQRVLIINMPPRHGKSRTAGLFAQWIFGKNPAEKIITGSYNEQLSTTFSRGVRNAIQERKASKDRIVYHDVFPNTKIKRGSSAANLWTLEGQHVSYLATSPGGTVTGFGATCFPAGTMIATPEGEVATQNLCVGDTVLSFNHKTGKIEHDKIHMMQLKRSARFVRFATSTGKEIVCTHDHRIFTAEYGYIEAEKLHVGITLTELTNVGVLDSRVISVQAEDDFNVVYDIEVENNHNFFANGVLVHNCMILDDIVKNADEAMNETVLENHWTWFTNTMLSRLEKNGKLVIIATRWNSNDLSGRAIDHYKAIGVDYNLITKKALQPDGSMLCDEVLDRKTYDVIVKTMGREIVEANYNQNPIDLVGRLYNLGFQTYKSLPTDGKGQNVLEEICAYVDTADQGDDYLCMIIYGLHRGQCYVLDIYFTKEGMEITEGEVAKRLYEHKVNRAFVESNNGGRGFGRSVERILREKYHWYKTYIDLFTQSRNKKSRILSSATWCQNNIKFPIGWEINYADFYGDVMSYQKEGKMIHDDAEDVLAGIYDRVGRGNLFSFT